MTTIARVLYEDQAGPVKDFGPHSLVVASVADELGRDRWDLARQIPGVPRKGDHKLLRSCREEAADWCRDGRPLVAVFDNDHVRTVLQLAPDACKSVVLESIRTGSTAPDRLRIVLLEKNMEDLVHATADALGEQPPSKKSINVRDALLQRAAAADRSVRDRIRGGASSFDRIVKILAALGR